jgi:hypothetical protein
MPTTILIRWTGFSSGDEAAALYDKVHAETMRSVDSGQFPGLLSHVCSKSTDGLVVVDVWKDPAVWEALFADPALIARFEQAGVPEPTSVEVLPTHNIEQR